MSTLYSIQIASTPASSIFVFSEVIIFSSFIHHASRNSSPQHSCQTFTWSQTDIDDDVIVRSADSGKASSDDEADDNWRNDSPSETYSDSGNDSGSDKDSDTKNDADAAE